MLKVNIKKKMEGFTLHVSFESEVETMALLGSSGSGKSMTLKCIAGIITPDEGYIIFQDKILFHSKKKINLPPKERKIGYLFQNYALFPNMTVEENIAVGIPKGRKKEKDNIVNEKIQAFLLSGLEKKRPNQLSGGQQQRVALARIIASEPDIILLDEPFSALDSFMRWQLERDLIDLLDKIQKPTLYVSHNRDEVYRVCSKIGVMNGGNLEVVKEKNDLFHNPVTLAAAHLTGCKNYSRLRIVDQHRIYAIDWGVTLYISKPVDEQYNYVGIRAHHIQILTDTTGSTNCIQCDVLKVIDNTFSYIIMLRNVLEKSNETNTQIRMEMRKDDWERMKGNQIFIRLDEDNLLLLS